jgi:hypothetical protein
MDEVKTPWIQDTSEISSAILDFMMEMQDKMLLKYRQGYRGWDDKENFEIIRRRLWDNIDDCDWVDVANLAMILHRFQQNK